MPVKNGTTTTQAKIDIVTEWLSEALGWEPSSYEERHGGARFTVNGHSDFQVLVEDKRAESESKERPQYE
jgi:hypothetical protein